MPIHITIVPIVTALNKNFWSTCKRKSINQKKIHLDKALANYPANKKAVIKKGTFNIE